MNRNCCSHFQLCINSSSMGCFVAFCVLPAPKLELGWKLLRGSMQEDFFLQKDFHETYSPT